MQMLHMQLTIQIAICVVTKLQLVGNSTIHTIHFHVIGAEFNHDQYPTPVFFILSCIYALF